MPYALTLKKENFKFSASHFTLFSASKAEHLHGHNYLVAIKLKLENVDPQLEMKADFAELKKIIRETCDTLDEKILLPRQSAYLSIEKSPHYPNHTEVRFQKRVYCFPDDEIRVLPVSNITSEALAKFLWDKLHLPFKRVATALSVSVQETSGQIATYYASL